MTSAWPCIEKWRRRTESGSSDIPNLSALRNFAHHLVQVADCSARRYNEFDREERPLGDILDLWEKEDESGRTLYVKDWHQALLLEKDGGKQDRVYTTPDVFQGQYHRGSLMVRDLHQKPITDDWMTHHALTLDPPDDYRFTYAGPRGTYTPLHRDVYGSYSWSSNIVGRKRWWLIPPEHTDIVWTRPGGNEVVFDLRELDETLWRGKVLQVVQEAGETIFVPSGWYHQVENLDFVSGRHTITSKRLLTERLQCISINQNFASSHIMPTIYRNLLESQARVEEAISDVKALLRDHAVQSIDSSKTVDSDVQPWEFEWLNQVQSLLEMDAGWGLRGFWGMVLHNLRVRIA